MPVEGSYLIPRSMCSLMPKPAARGAGGRACQRLRRQARAPHQAARRAACRGRGAGAAAAGRTRRPSPAPRRSPRRPALTPQRATLGPRALRTEVAALAEVLADQLVLLHLEAGVLGGGGKQWGGGVSRGALLMCARERLLARRPAAGAAARRKRSCRSHGCYSTAAAAV
jgi:hypothetical protein